MSAIFSHICTSFGIYSVASCRYILLYSSFCLEIRNPDLASRIGLLRFSFLDLHSACFPLVGGLNVSDFFSHLYLFRYSHCSFLSIHPSV